MSAAVEGASWAALTNDLDEIIEAISRQTQDFRDYLVSCNQWGDDGGCHIWYQDNGQTVLKLE